MAQWQDSDGERNGLRLPQSRTLQDGDLLSLRRTRSLSQTGSISMNARPDHNIWWSPTLNPEAGIFIVSVALFPFYLQATCQKVLRHEFDQPYFESIVRAYRLE